MTRERSADDRRPGVLRRWVRRVVERLGLEAHFDAVGVDGAADDERGRAVTATRTRTTAAGHRVVTAVVVATATAIAVETALFGLYVTLGAPGRAGVEAGAAGSFSFVPLYALYAVALPAVVVGVLLWHHAEPARVPSGIRPTVDVVVPIGLVAAVGVFTVAPTAGSGPLTATFPAAEPWHGADAIGLAIGGAVGAAWFGTRCTPPDSDLRVRHVVAVTLLSVAVLVVVHLGIALPLWQGVGGPWSEGLLGVLAATV